MPAPSKKPAVLHVLEALEGGTCRHVRELLPELSARGYPVTLAASFRRDPALCHAIAPAFAEHGIALHELPMRRAVSPLSDLRSLLRLTRLIKTLKPSIIHTHSSKAGFLGRLAGAAQGVPVVHTPHAFPFLMEGGRGKRWLYRFLERLVQPKTSALIAVSQEEAEAARELLGFPPERVHLIPNGTRYPAPPPSDAVPRTALGFFGRLSRQKGADLLLRAIADMDIEVDIHGDGEEAAALRRQCETLRMAHRAHFMGACLQEDVVACMRRYAAIVIPSRWEGFPYVMLDACAAGVPVIAANVGGIPDLIRDGVNGVLFPAGDAQALSAAIAALLRNPPHANTRALATHTLSGMTDKVEAVYKLMFKTISLDKRPPQPALEST